MFPRCASSSDAVRKIKYQILRRIGHLPRIGDIIDMLHLRHTQATYDKIGRSLAGLRKRGEIEVHFGPEEKYGKGGRWCLTDRGLGRESRTRDLVANREREI
jgi:hypothetical protein